MRATTIPLASSFSQGKGKRLKKAPSEYVLENVKFTSEPAIEVPTTAYVESILEMMHANRTLLFSSDYPHYDMDMPQLVFKHVASSLRRRTIESPGFAFLVRRKSVILVSRYSFRVPPKNLLL